MQFDFPNEEGKPYKSSGGKMVYNPILKREIPEGWDNGVLSQIANITMGQSPNGESYNEDGEGIIVRGYESLGGKCRTELSLGFDAKSVELCDLQENKLSDLALENGKIKLSASNFEIVTLKIKI